VARTRARAKGRRGGEVEHFAKIPVSVLESEACKTLDHAAFKVLACLASGFSGRNNGTMAMTPRFAQRFGFKGRNTVYRSLADLVERGLLVQTRQGLKMKNVFALFALGWEDIHSRDGKLLEVPQPRNNLRWLNWRAPVPTMGTDTNDSKINSGTHHGYQPVPTMGTGGTECVPTMGTRWPICVPTMGNTLRSRPPEGGSERSFSKLGERAPDPDLDVRILKLIRSQPHLPDGDIAKIMKADQMHVARLRQVEELDAREAHS
jgi:hypothetical protein